MLCILHHIVKCRTIVYIGESFTMLIIISNHVFHLQCLNYYSAGAMNVLLLQAISCWAYYIISLFEVLKELVPSFQAFYAQSS